MKNKRLTLLFVVVLWLPIVILELVLFTSCCHHNDEEYKIEYGEESDTIKRSKKRTTSTGLAWGSAQADTTYMHITEWIYAHGIYTPATTSSVLRPVFQEHGYLAIKVPHPPPTCTGQIVRTGAYSPTANFSYWTYATTSTEVITDVPLEFRDDLIPTVESKYPSGPDAHWEVLWSERGYEWPEPDEPLEWPEVQLDYYFDFCGAPCWGCDFEYLLCLGSFCYGPTPERIHSHWGAGTGALVDFRPMAWQVVTPTVRFTNTNELCNFDSITHTYDLTYTSSRNWDYTFYTRDTGTSPAVQADTITIGPAPSWGECKYVDLAATTTETDTKETVLITATSQLTPSVYAEVVNAVITPWYPITAPPAEVDLSIGKVASGGVITAGERITYTVTITNGGPTTPVTATVVDTFSDPGAIAGVTSDGDCTWTSGSAAVTCNVTGIVTGTPSHLRLFVTTNGVYSGTLSNMAVITPTGNVTDTNTPNNRAGPVEVIVKGVGYRIYLPVVLRGF